MSRKKLTETERIGRRSKPKKHHDLTDEDLRPDLLEDLLVDGTGPFESIVKAARENGIADEVTKSIVERVKKQYQPVIGELRKVQTHEISSMLDDRIHGALSFLTNEKFEKSSAKDLAIITGILLEKRALLRGEPTQILSIDDRSNMNELLPKLLQEAKKRGMFVDVLEGEVNVVVDHERQYRPRAKINVQDRMRMKTINEKDDIGEPN